ncbi:hypothetical protein [Dongia sp.]|jgi:hypothetical protein|uniref:hypothetical protein n=1 Tax=Dongia sp. TaxID=1977262 RepID=UPI0035B4BA74
MHALKVWLRLATASERVKLAEYAGTKVSYLYFLSNPDAAYGRTATADLAGRLEAAAERIRAEGGEDVKRRLPKLLRTDMSPTCRGCAFAQRCLGDAAIASEFGYEAMPKEGALESS